jgi:hypothetical protein
MCAIEAALFNSGISNAAVCVYSMAAPLGMRTENGLCDLTLLKHGALTNIKMACASITYYGCLVWFKKRWVSTVFKHCFII